MIRVGVSLFSFTGEFVRLRYTLEELLARVAELELGPGIELVGFQSLRNFPFVDDAAVRRFRETIDAHGLETVCVGGSADIGGRGDRDRNEDELVEFGTAQLEAAARLGFGLLTLQATTPLGAARRLVPAAERLGLVLGLEIGGHFLVDDPPIVAAHEVVEELDTPHLGFVLDFGTSTRALSRTAVEAQRRRGMHEDAIALVLDAYARAHAREQHQGAIRGELLERIAVFDDPEALTFAWRTTALFGHQPPEGWAPLVPRIVHVHAKAFESDEDGADPTIDVPALVGVLRDGGYDGWITSEWEGHLFADHDDNFGPVVRQQRVLRRLVEVPATPEPARR
jgi:sugar phosphate isomerase/epimerase